MADSKLTISKKAIQDVGDHTIDWIESKIGGGWLGNKVLEFVRGEWDTVGVEAVAKVMVDAGWTVTE
jgi:hypothetical protein